MVVELDAAKATVVRVKGRSAVPMSPTIFKGLLEATKDGKLEEFIEAHKKEATKHHVWRRLFWRDSQNVLLPAWKSYDKAGNEVLVKEKEKDPEGSVRQVGGLVGRQLSDSPGKGRKRWDWFLTEDGAKVLAALDDEKSETKVMAPEVKEAKAGAETKAAKPRSRSKPKASSKEPQVQEHAKAA